MIQKEGRGGGAEGGENRRSRRRGEGGSRREGGERGGPDQLKIVNTEKNTKKTVWKTNEKTHLKEKYEESNMLAILIFQNNNSYRNQNLCCKSLDQALISILCRWINLIPIRYPLGFMVLPCREDYN